jgi:HAD superfamily hydrolase (TIGR01509 family)
MDGVIVDSNPHHKIALRQFCEEHGHHLSDEELRERIYGRTNKDWIANVFGNIGADKIAQYGEEKEALFRQLYEKDITPLEGLIDFLKLLEKGKYPKAIATSAPRSNVDFVLEKTGTGDFFPVILDESFVTRGKPDPAIYIKTAKALAFEPGQCIVFEDSLSGVKAGKAAGCKVVGITTTHTREELNETDWVIDNFKGVSPEILISRLF